MWLYKGREIKEIKDFGSEIYGFIYKITDNKTGKIYIGKKILFSNRKKKLTRAEIDELPLKKGRKKRFKRDIQETNWIDYYGSSKTLLAEINTRGKLDFQREVLTLCRTKKQLTYYELYHQITNNVLMIDSYNDNIAGHFYRRDLIDL